MSDRANELLLQVPEVKDLVAKGWKMPKTKLGIAAVLLKLGWHKPGMKMRPGGGKAKGGEWERTCCKILSTWWSAGKSADLCWRTAGSGAKATMVGGGKFYFGDIGPVGPEMHIVFENFSIDVKHYKSLDLLELLRPIKSPMILQFWRQCLRDARKSNRWPALIYKVNFMPALIAFDVRMLKYFDISKLTGNKKMLNTVTLGHRILLINFDEFIEYTDVSEFKKGLGSMESFKKIIRQPAVL